jgi:riboflavin biosynthesis pyrimidine reductase
MEERSLQAMAGSGAETFALTGQTYPRVVDTFVLADLASVGLGRLVLLGGADLAGQLLAAGLVDELQLTLCPLLLGGAHSWCPVGTRPDPGRWRLLEQRLLAGEELLLRFGRIQPDQPRMPA